MSGFLVKNPGALTTVQDGGRMGAQGLGFGTAGAMDLQSLFLLNILLGNDLNEAALEATLLGPEITFLEDNCFALTGADMGATLDGVPVPRYEAVTAKKGSVLKLGFAKSGVRAYIGFAGGMEIPMVMGSKSTSLKYHLGGVEGRALLSGDRISFTAPRKELRHQKRRKLDVPDFSAKEQDIRVVLGMQQEYFTKEGIRTFFESPYEISGQSDRMGYRLDGEPVSYEDTVDIISDAIVPGAIQIPSNGKPIILMADRQTTGGYAKIGAVISADLPRLAQMGPGAVIHFKEVSVEEAQELLAKERKEMIKQNRRMNRWL